MYKRQREKPETIGGTRLKPIVRHGLAVMSIGFLIEEETPMIWRGPMVTSALTQMLREVEWGTLDVMVVDMPPGTGDAQLAQRVFHPYDRHVEAIEAVDARRKSDRVCAFVARVKMQRGASGRGARRLRHYHGAPVSYTHLSPCATGTHMTWPAL